MLVLSRKIGEVIRIGEMELVVVEVRGARVKLGFKGPRDIQIQRGELTNIAPERITSAVIPRNPGATTEVAEEAPWARPHVGTGV